jgi:YbbR domain-containing protein
MKWLGRFLRAIITRLPAAVVSFLFAAFIWIFVAMSRKYTAVEAFPVVVDAKDSERAVRSGIPKTVSVKLEGEGWKILSTYFSRIEWRIDLSTEIDKNEIAISMTKNAALYLKPLPEGLKALAVEPDTLVLRLEEKISKHIPIRLVGTLEPKSGYVVQDSLQFEPDSLTVTGAKSIVSSLKFWETSPAKYSDLIGKFSVLLPLSDSLSPLVELSAHKVEIAGLSEQLTELEYVDIPVSVTGQSLSKALTLIPSKVNLTLRGGLSTLANVKASALKASVSFNDLVSDTTGAVPPKVVPPKGTTLIRCEPEKLQYILRK